MANNFILQRTHFIVCGLLIVWSLNLDVYTNLNFFDQKRIIQAAFFTVLLSLYFFTIFNDSVFFVKIDNSLIISLLCFFCLGFISASLSEFRQASFLEFIHTILLVIITYIIATTFKKYAQLFKLGFTIVIVGYGAVLIKFFAGILAAFFSGHKMDAQILYTGFVNVNFMGQIIGIMIPALLILCCQAERKLQSVLFIMLVISWLMLLIGGVRSVLLCQLVLAIIVILFCELYRWKYIVFSCASIAIAYLLFVSTQSVDAIDYSSLSFIRGSSERLVLWEDAYKIWEENVFFGVGPYGLALVSNSISVSHPHNILVQILSEWGLLSFLVMSFIAVKLLVIGFKTLGRTNDICFILSFLCVLAGLGHSLFSGVFVMPISQTLMTILVGVCIGSSESILDKPAFGWIRSSSIVMIIFVYIVWVSLVVSSYLIYKSSTLPCVYNIGPRFWLVGGIECKKSNFYTYKISGDVN